MPVVVEVEQFTLKQVQVALVVVEQGKMAMVMVLPVLQILAVEVVEVLGIVAQVVQVAQA
jgi:hypothetical protein